MRLMLASSIRPRADRPVASLATGSSTARSWPVGCWPSFSHACSVASGDGNADNTKPFNPKHVTYEITGASGASVDVDYLDENGQPHRVDAAQMRWSYTIVTTPLRSSSVLWPMVLAL